MDPWIWAVILLALGLAFAALEIFFPSAGLLSFLAVAALIGSIIMAFQAGPLIGLAIIGAVVVGLPVVVIVGLKYWPKTAIGKRVMLAAPSSEEVLPNDEHLEFIDSLVGEVGTAGCDMFPGGVITIKGRTIDAVSEGMVIEKGQPVEVVQVHSNYVTVRPVQTAPEKMEDETLGRPVDEVLDEDPFADEP